MKSSIDKVTIIADLHGNPIWKKIVKKEIDSDLVIFLGDYFDSKGIYTTIEQIHNFNEIIQFKKANPHRVVILYGNHDHLYLPETGDKAYISGWQGEEKGMNIAYVLRHASHLMSVAFDYKNILFSHAGISIDWIESISLLRNIDLPNMNAKEMASFTNEAWNETPKYFSFLFGGDPSGDNTYQSPIWIRPKSLIKNNRDIEKNIIQIVGHTPQERIVIDDETFNFRYFFIDTINTNREYLVIQNDKFINKTI